MRKNAGWGWHFIGGEEAVGVGRGAAVGGDVCGREQLGGTEGRRWRHGRGEVMVAKAVEGAGGGAWHGELAGDDSGGGGDGVGGGDVTAMTKGEGARGKWHHRLRKTRREKR